MSSQPELYCIMYMYSVRYIISYKTDKHYMFKYYRLIVFDRIRLEHYQILLEMLIHLSTKCCYSICTNTASCPTESTTYGCSIHRQWTSLRYKNRCVK